MTLATHLLLFARDLVLTVLVEGAVLWFALEPIHARATKLLAAVWLSSCTLPIVQFVFPLLSRVGWPRWAWVAGAEIFAPAAECAMFAALVASQSGPTRRASMRDMLAIILANLASFGFGELLRAIGVR